MKKMPLISIIIPVYNVQDYIVECLESIIHQSYKNIEILLVNDGTKDNSGEICKEYALKDTRIKYLEKENGGISSARNHGLDHVTGDYITFIDSDDFIHRDYFKILLDNLDDFDIVFCNAVYYETGTPKVEPSQEAINSVRTTTFTSLELLKKINVFKRPLVIVPWGKLYKKEIWDNIRYPEGRSHEDEAVVHLYIDQAQKIKYIDLNLYYYRQSVAGSETNTICSRKINNFYQAYQERATFFDKKGLHKEATVIRDRGKGYLYRKMIKLNLPSDELNYSSILKDKNLFISTKIELIFKLLFKRSKIN